jgi:hypothetical protein
VSNGNSFADVIVLQNNKQPLTLSSTTTFHGSFQMGGSAALLTIPNPMTVAIEGGEFFPGASAQGKPFIMRAAGLVTGGQRYQIDIVQGTGLTPVVASTGLSQGGLQNDNWLVEVQCMWDTSSGFLRGIQYGWVGATAITQQALSQSISGLTLTTLQFNVAVTIATANANALFTLTEFSAEFI